MVMGFPQIYNPLVTELVVDPTLNPLVVLSLISLLTRNDFPVRYKPAMVTTAIGFSKLVKKCLAYWVR